MLNFLKLQPPTSNSIPKPKPYNSKPPTSPQTLILKMCHFTYFAIWAIITCVIIAYAIFTVPFLPVPFLPVPFLPMPFLPVLLLPDIDLALSPIWLWLHTLFLCIQLIQQWLFHAWGLMAALLTTLFSAATCHLSVFISLHFMLCLATSLNRSRGLP